MGVTGPGVPQEQIKNGLDRASTNYTPPGQHEVYVIPGGPAFGFDPKSLHYAIMFDDYLSLELAKQPAMSPDVFLGVGCASTHQIMAVKENGGKCVTTWFSSHYRNAAEILEPEYKANGITRPAIDYHQSLRNEKEYRLCDALIAPSEFCAETYRKYISPREKVNVVPFGVDSKKFHPADDSTVDLTFSVIYAGGNNVRKGLAYLLKAWSDLQLKDGMLNILSIGSNQSLWRTKFHGWIPDDQIPGMYRQAKVFCLPSLEEGSALVVYEAMASGLPCIVTEQCGSIVDDGKDGLIVPVKDIEALKKGIKYFHDNPSEIKRMGKNAREKVEQYTWERFGDGVVKVLEEVGKR